MFHFLSISNTHFSAASKRNSYGALKTRIKILVASTFATIINHNAMRLVFPPLSQAGEGRGEGARNGEGLGNPHLPCSYLPAIIFNESILFR